MHKFFKTLFLLPNCLDVVITNTAFLVPGLHCAEEGHKANVRYEIHEQTPMHRKRCSQERST